MKPDNGPAIRAIDAPESWAGWPDDRVSCANCALRRGFRCEPRGICHPLEVRHRCEEYRRG